jgi:cation diffusion facilitator CzcD-associated flavoprotein CzcO
MEHRQTAQHHVPQRPSYLIQADDGFQRIPDGSDIADYPRHAEVFRYFQQFASHFRLAERYRFNTEVVAVVFATWRSTVWPIMSTWTPAAGRCANLSRTLRSEIDRGSKLTGVDSEQGR